MTSLRTAAFLKRLQTELPVWVQRGWVSSKHQQAIITHVAQQAQDSQRYLVLVFSAMGALLLGAGVITFFAANWGLIPKAAKLAILFGALGACYGAATVCFARRFETVGHGLLLLGVILFGANIFLIAQIYHIDAHYPNGVLVWSLGALATAGLARSQLALVVALALALLWSGMEMFMFDRAPHGWFFVPWLAALGLIYRHRWIPALRVACAALLAWCLFLVFTRHFMDRFWFGGERMALGQVYVFLGIALYILGRGMSWYPRWQRFAPPVVTAGAVAAVAALFVLSFPEAHRFGVRQEIEGGPVLPNAWLGVTAAVLAFVAGLMMWRYHSTKLSTLPRYRQGAFVWLVAAGALALVNLFGAGRYPGWVAFGYNLLACAGVIWLVLTGIDRGERRIVNLGFVFFAALLLARYFDTFWSLLDRSYFFMAGGALLLVAGGLLERSRRRLTARMKHTRGAA